MIRPTTVFAPTRAGPRGQLGLALCLLLATTTAGGCAMGLTHGSDETDTFEPEEGADDGSDSASEDDDAAPEDGDDDTTPGDEGDDDTTTGESEGPECADGVADGNEVCDDTDLRGQSCLGLGYDAGALGCAEDCLSLDPSDCYFAACDLEVSPASGDPDTTFTLQTGSNWPVCRWKLDGEGQGLIDCASESAATISAADLEPGEHTARLRLLQVPSGNQICEATFVVEEPEPTPEETEPSCTFSTLADAASITSAGFSRNNGTFRDGGWAVDARRDHIYQEFTGDWNTGSISFEAKDLWVQHTMQPQGGGCERFVISVNRQIWQEPEPTRFYLASMADGCLPGNTMGNLKVIVPEGGCCLKGPTMPLTSDGLWHTFELTWNALEFWLYKDGALLATRSYNASGNTVGQFLHFRLGSIGLATDPVLAVFRNLEICGP